MCEVITGPMALIFCLSTLLRATHWMDSERCETLHRKIKESVESAQSVAVE